MNFFATCARGLEPVLARELLALGAGAVEAGRGGATFAGDLATLYKANLWLRTAVRVLRPLLEVEVRTTDELYDAVRTVDWTQWMTPDHTLAVDCNVRDSAITHSQYAARRVKDAICDQFVDRVGRRPSVDVERPMVPLNLHVSRDYAILSLDASWDSLHKRGYRPALTRAPLNEALAAGLILTTGWNPATPLVDPMCGSGTLPIEAAMIALNRPPGLTRKHFGFMGWMDYDVALWADLREQAREGVAKALPALITGSDVRGDAVRHAETNARAAGLGHLLTFSRADVADFVPPDGPPGVIICNAPYGERLGEERELIPLYETLGEVFRTRCAGWACWLFTTGRELTRAVGSRPRSAVDFFNGALTCRLMRFGPAR